MGQDTPVIRPAAATVAHSPSTTRSPACSRSRVVIRAPAGTAGIDSVNDLRPHHGARQYQRRLRHTSSIRVRPCGRSRGRVHTCSFTRVEITPHVGQAAAVSSAVATSTSSVSAALALHERHRQPVQTQQQRRVPRARTGAGRILIQARSPGVLIV